jgi:hypothetical protein
VLTQSGGERLDDTGDVVEQGEYRWAGQPQHLAGRQGDGLYPLCITIQERHLPKVGGWMQGGQAEGPAIGGLKDQLDHPSREQEQRIPGVVGMHNDRLPGIIVGLEMGHERGHRGLREPGKERELAEKGGIVGARESVDDGAHRETSLSLK